MGRLVQIGASVVLIVASTLLPWATYRNQQLHETTEFHSGALGPWLVALGGVFIALVLLSASWRAPVLRRLNKVVAIGAILLSVVAALSRIRAANEASVHAVAGRGLQTSFAIGAALAVIAAIVMAVTTLIADAQ